MKEVLLIDDDPKFQRLVGLLIDTDWTIDPALTFKDGLNKALTNHYDLIIVDIRLDDSQSGLDLTEDILQNKPDAHIVVISGVVCSEVAAGLLRDWKVKFYEKPSTRDALFNILNER